MRYMVEAENRGATFGSLFPTLPPSFLQAAKLASKENDESDSTAKNKRRASYRRRDSNPHALSDGGF